MTDEALDLLICRLNSGDLIGQAFIQPLKDNVYVGLVWPELPKGEVFGEQGYTMFFIRGDAGPFVAIVLDMGAGDIHIYLQREHRGKGLMERALKDVILPFLFKSGRPEQKVTFARQGVGRFLQRLGFRLTSESTASLTPTDLPTVDVPVPVFTKLDATRAESLKQRVWQAAGLARICRDELKAVGRDDYAAELDTLAHDLVDLGSEVGDLGQTG
jgi:GNAT superfamily N-acetyltransferase